MSEFNSNENTKANLTKKDIAILASIILIFSAGFAWFYNSYNIRKFDNVRIGFYNPRFRATINPRRIALGDSTFDINVDESRVNEFKEASLQGYCFNITVEGLLVNQVIDATRVPCAKIR